MEQVDQAQPQDEAQAESATPVIKAMRRQPCPCGSGKVFKNCHEGAPGYAVATDPGEAAAAPAPKAEKGPKGPGPKSFQGPAPKFGGPARNTGTSHRRKV